MLGSWHRFSVSIFTFNQLIHRYNLFLSGVVVNGLSVLALAFSGSDLVLSATFFTISVILNGAVTSGALSSVIDISPNFASITVGIMATVTSMTGFISPWIVGSLTEGRQHNVEPWMLIFKLCAATQIICGVLYLMFSDSTLQEWNKPQYLTICCEAKEEECSLVFDCKAK